MRNRYVEMTKRQMDEYNKFPMMFAFNDEQFSEGMAKLGLTSEDTDKVVSFGHGGYIRKSDSEAFAEMVRRQRKEMRDNVQNDTTGEGFIYEMFYYELANHEYAYTRDAESTLEALGLTYEDIHENENLKHGLKLAIDKIVSEDDD